MRVLLRVAFFLSLIGAVTALVVVNDALARSAPAYLAGPVAAAALIGFAFGFGAGRRRAANEPSSPVDSGLLTDPALANLQDDRAALAFARKLLAATASETLRTTVEQELSLMLCGRKVWITWDAQHRRPESAAGSRQQDAILSDDVQEWTTFALRMDGQRLGLLGVESAGGLRPEFKQHIQTLCPLIAQAVKTVHEVETFREASVVDLLTGASTRREGLNRLQAEVKRAQRTGSTMAVLMIDLDHFKSINDRYGHAAGDTLLTSIGETMLRTLRASDIRCRWGGEEFLVVLPDTTLAQAQVVATHLLHNIAAAAAPSPRGPVSSTASIGLTIARPAETDVNRIVGRADMALYQAKNAGRSCIRVVLGGLDGAPVGTDNPPKPPTSTNATLPFPDRRNPSRADRRKVPGPGRRRTDSPPAIQDRRASGVAAR